MGATGSRSTSAALSKYASLSFKAHFLLQALPRFKALIVSMLLCMLGFEFLEGAVIVDPDLNK
jgi:hypothetical protein